VEESNVSRAIQAVIGIVEIAAGLLLPGGPYPWLIGMGAAQLLGVAAQLLNDPGRPPVSPIDVAYSGTLEPRRILYGTMKLSGMHTVPPLTSGPCHDLTDVALALNS
jgi:hypothetical protein